MFTRQTYSTQTFSIEADIADSLKFLESLGVHKDKSLKRILSGVGTVAKNQVRKAYKSQGLAKGTGALYKSITRKVIRSGKAVIVEAKAQSAHSKVFYGYAIAKGAHITAKNDTYLTFQKQGKWIKVHAVTLPERDFVATPVKNYLCSPAFNQKLDELVQKEVHRIEKEHTR